VKNSAGFHPALTVDIDQERVRALAGIVAELRGSAELSSEMAPPWNCGRESSLRAYFWAAAICHSTKSGLNGYFHGAYYKGWDYMLRAFLAAAVRSESAVDPATISSIDGPGLRQLLLSGATRNEVTLTDLDRRAEILRITAVELMERYAGRVSGLLAAADRRMGGPNGAYARLGELTAFRDAQRKKSTCFLVTAHYSGRFPLVDPESAVPMVDYHRMRLLLRTGCIVVAPAEVESRLRSREPVDPAVEERIRAAAYEISNQVPLLAGMNMFDFDVMLWAHARSCCRNAPACVSGVHENKSFLKFSIGTDPHSCVFKDVCPGAADARRRELWEPIARTENY